MTLNAPTLLYKYQSRDTGKAVLSNRTLRWSTPAQLNDPFDIQFDLNMEVDAVKTRELALEKLWQAYQGDLPLAPKKPMAVAVTLLRVMCPGMARSELRNELEGSIDEGLSNGRKLIPETIEQSRQIMRTCKILCLTTSAINALMWSHYAEGHKGIVLEFSALNDSPYTLAQPVNYLDSIPALYDEETLSDVLAGTASIDVRKALDAMVYTKAKEWAYENEWRVFTGDGRDKEAPYEDVPFGHKELTAIIFGAKMPEPNRIEFAAMAKAINPDIRLLEAKLAAPFKIELSAI